MSEQEVTHPVDAQDGWGAAMGIRFVKAEADEVILEMPVDARHHQPMGIVHGGVYCGLVETACSVGGHLAAQSYGRLAVGVDNQTSFLKAVRGGTLTTTARPLAGGRRTGLWEARIEDDAGRLVAVGRLRVLTLEAGTNLAGEELTIAAQEQDEQG